MQSGTYWENLCCQDKSNNRLPPFTPLPALNTHTLALCCCGNVRARELVDATSIEPEELRSPFFFGLCPQEPDNRVIALFTFFRAGLPLPSNYCLLDNDIVRLEMRTSVPILPQSKHPLQEPVKEGSLKTIGMSFKRWFNTKRKTWAPFLSKL